MILDKIDHRRAIIDRRALADRLASLRGGRLLNDEATKILRGALEYGRAEVAEGLGGDPGNGRAAAQAPAYLHAQLVRRPYDFVNPRLLAEPPAGLAIVGLGGT